MNMAMNFIEFQDKCFRRKSLLYEVSENKRGFSFNSDAAQYQP